MIMSAAQKLAFRSTDTVGPLEKAPRSRWAGSMSRVAVFAACLSLALLLRGHTLGDPNYRNDEAFYLLVGQQLHQGATLYVDIWDRKPPGIFLIYYAATALPDPVLGYQLLALLAASLTASVIARIVTRFATMGAGLLCAGWYLSSLMILDGGGGQSPVFYNLCIVLAAFLVAFPSRFSNRYPFMSQAVAMLLAGIAITVKHVAVFEAVFLGLYALNQARRSGFSLFEIIQRGATLAAVGAAPALLTIAWFSWSGHLVEFLQAMVYSNGTRWSQLGDPQATQRLGMFVQYLCAPIGLSFFSWLRGRHDTTFSPYIIFLVFWLAASLAGALAAPLAYYHYLLPVLVPLSIFIGYAVARGRIFALCCIVISIISMSPSPPWSFETTARHKMQFSSVETLIKTHDPKPRLFVFYGPLLLYSSLGVKPLGPLVFRPHLSDPSERDVSHLKTASEVRRMLKLRPTTVLLPTDERYLGRSSETFRLVKAYAQRHCKLVGTSPLEEEGAAMGDIGVYSHCE